MKKIIIISQFLFWLAMLLATRSLFAQKSVTLKDLISIAESESSFGKLAQLDKERNEMIYKLNIARTKFSVGLNGILPLFSQTFSSTIQPDGNIAYTPIRYDNSFANLWALQPIVPTGGSLYANSSIERFNNFDNGETNWNASLIRIGINQPLRRYNPLKWNKSLWKVDLKRSVQKYNFDLEQMFLNTANLFFDALIAQTELELSQLTYDNNQKLYKIAEEKLAVGKISENDRLQLEYELTRSEANLEWVSANFESSVKQLELYLNTSFDDDIIFDDNDLTVFDALVNGEELIQLALENSFERSEIEFNEINAQKNLAEAKANAGINATIDASVGLRKGDNNFNSLYVDQRTEQNLQINFSVPIYRHQQSKYEKKIAELELDMARESQKYKCDELSNQIRIELVNLERNKERLTHTKTGRDLAIGRFNNMKEAFKLGSVSTLELTLAQADQGNAVRAYMNSLRDYWLSYYRLRILTMFDIKENQKIIH